MRRVIITWSEAHALEESEDTVVIVYPSPISITKMVGVAVRMRPDEIIVRMNHE